jgi:hypothetical protein
MDSELARQQSLKDESAGNAAQQADANAQTPGDDKAADEASGEKVSQDKQKPEEPAAGKPEDKGKAEG